MGKLTKRAQVEDKERWEYWRSKIPAIIFPSHWQVRVIPPWGNVMARFWVDPVGIIPNPEAPTVCVYLDTNNTQGCYPDEEEKSYFNPYWETTSWATEDGTPFRCGMHETNKLVDNINDTLKIFWMELKKENKNKGKRFIDGNRCVSYGSMQIKIQSGFSNLIDTPETLDQIYIDEKLCKNVKFNDELIDTEPDYGDSPDPEKVKKRLEKAKAEWTSEGWVVEGDLDLSELNLVRLPLIKEVGGNFYCSFNQLTTLKGCLQEVSGNFYCYNNQLTSLEGAPKEVSGDFYCSNNQLTSLEGAPKEVSGDFDCSNNQLISLEGCPQKVGGNFYCSNNQLTTLEGCPQSVDGGFYCSSNQLTSLEGAPKEVGGNFYCSNNQLTSLKGCPQKVGNDFYCSNNQLTSLDGISEVGGKVYSDLDKNLIDAEYVGLNKDSVKVSEPVMFSESCWYESVSQKSEDIGKEDFCISICAKDGKITDIKRITGMMKDESNHWVNFISDGKNFKPVSIDLEVPIKKLNIAKLSECTLVKEKGFMELQDREGKRVDLFIREVDENGKPIPIVIGDPKNEICKSNKK